jgi:hypothetical protein
VPHASLVPPPPFPEEKAGVGPGLLGYQIAKVASALGAYAAADEWSR